MKVVVISQLPPPRHGSTIMTEHFLRAMHELGHDTHLVDRRFSKSLSDIGRFSMRKVLSAIWMPLRLMTAVIRMKADAAVLFVTNRSLSFLVDIALSAVLRVARVRTILYVHTSGWNDLIARGGFWRWGASFIFRAARVIVVLGPSLAHDLRAVVKLDALMTVRNTSDIGARFSDSKNDLAGLNVVFISNLIPSKGVIDFIELAEVVSPRKSGVRFSIYGAPTDQAFTASVYRRIEESGVGSLAYEGMIGSSDQMRTILEQADLLVFPSQYEFEAQPLTIIESLSAGVPVAAYDVGGVSDVVNSEHGALAAAGDVSALADFTLALANDRKLLAAKSIAARTFYANNLSLDAYRKHWSEVLRRATLD